MFRPYRPSLEVLEDRLTPSAIRDLGFTTNILPANDDDSTSAVSLGFTLDFLGVNHSQVFVNNNGNVTFDAPLPTFIPFDLTTTSIPIIAPFFADLDTRGEGSGVVHYGSGMLNGRRAFAVDWFDPVTDLGTGYFDSNTDKLNRFQLILREIGLPGSGHFAIEFNYDQIEWESGDADLEQCEEDCLTVESARAGFSNGTGQPGTSFELVGSGIPGSFLDNGPANTSLIQNSRNSGIDGRYVFLIRGVPGNFDPDPATTLAIEGLPSSTTAGAIETFTVTALDSFGNIDVNYTGTVTFSSNDPQSMLPQNYTFTTGQGGDNGVHTFTAAFRSGGSRSLTVRDTQNPTLTATQSTIQVQPQLQLSRRTLTPALDVSFTQGVASFTDVSPGSPGNYLAIINWGDSTVTTGIVTTSQGSFVVMGTHTYTAIDTFPILVTLTDVAGNTVERIISSAAVLTGSQSTRVVDSGLVLCSEGTTLLATSSSGITANLNQGALADCATTLFVATFDGNPQSIQSDGSVFFDVRVTGAGDSAQLVVQFNFPDRGGSDVVLQFFDSGSNRFRPVQGSSLLANSLVIDRVNRTITVTFDSSSFPTLSDLRGTVFTISVQPSSSGTVSSTASAAVPTTTTTTLTPDVALATTSSLTSDAGSNGLRRQVTFQSSSQVTLSLTPGQASQGLSFEGTPSGGSDEEKKPSEEVDLHALLERMLREMASFWGLFDSVQVLPDNEPTPAPEPAPKSDPQEPPCDSTESSSTSPLSSLSQDLIPVAVDAIFAAGPANEAFPGALQSEGTVAPSQPERLEEGNSLGNWSWMAAAFLIGCVQSTYLVGRKISNPINRVCFARQRSSRSSEGG